MSSWLISRLLCLEYHFYADDTPDCLLHKLQVIQNSAARLLVKLPKHSNISPTLASLHWLPIAYRIEYKLLLMVFKALNGFAPAYIADMLQPKVASSRSLRSDHQNLLVIPRSHSKTYGDRNFRYAAPFLWNGIPLDLRLCTDLKDFKRSLKTYLFKKAFC